MKIGWTAALILASVSIASAEVVTTTDGRKLELNADGTYKILTNDTSSAAITMTEEKPFFEPFAGEYGQNSIRFMPIFRNETKKTVVGFRFRSVFTSAFGDEVFAFSGESSEKTLDGASSTADIFYFFEDNQFIPDEPYDKLIVFEGSGTGKISTKITAVVFEDGTVIQADQ